MCCAGDTCIHVQTVFYWCSSKAFFQQEGKRKPEVKQQGRQIGLCVSLRAAMNSEGWLLKYTRDQVFLCVFFAVLCAVGVVRKSGTGFDEVGFSLGACCNLNGS